METLIILKYGGYLLRLLEAILAKEGV